MNDKSREVLPQRRRGIIRRTVTPFVDVGTWIGYAQLAQLTKMVGGTIKDLFTARKAEFDETFEEALKRLKLKEEDVQSKIRVFTFLSIFWFLVSIGMVFYGVYLAGNRSWYGFLACIGLSMVLLSQAFYYHFWMFQMKQRRLGCTFQDWWNANFTGGGS